MNIPPKGSGIAPLPAPFASGFSSAVQLWATVFLLAALSPVATGQEPAEQSPIDIRSPATVFTNLPALVFNYAESVNLSMVYTTTSDGEENTRIDVPAGAAETQVGGARHTMLQFHLHSKAEHLVNGHRAPMELHMVHRRPDGGLLVIGRLIHEGAYNATLDAIVTNIAGLAEDEHAAVHLAGFDLGELAPSLLTSFRYDGSLTTPEFEEDVQWILLSEPLELSAAQIASYREVFAHGNSREEQPLNCRVVLTDVPGFTTAPKAGITVTSVADHGHGSLRRALDDIADGGVISFDANLNGRTINLTSGQLVVCRNVTVRGPGADLLGINGSGNHSNRVFYIAPGVNAILSGLTVKGATISSVDRGAGILNRGNLTLTGCVVSGNQVVWDRRFDPNGGGIMNDFGGVLTVLDCSIHGNFAYYGAGIYNFGHMDVTQTTISGNRAAVFGSGILSWGSAALNFVTIAANPRGGLHVGGGPVTVRNSVFSGNTVLGNLSGAGSIVSLGHNLSSDATGGLAGPGDVRGVDPKLGPLADNGGPTPTHALPPDSLAIDTGDNAGIGALTGDQRGLGYPRLVSTTVDIGAVEAPHTVISAADSGPGSLRQAILDARPEGTIQFATALNNARILLTTGELIIDKSLSLLGLGADRLAVSGNDRVRVFRVTSNSPPNSVLLAGLTITDGAPSSGGGGGVYCDHASVVISNCHVTANSAFYGGGVFLGATRGPGQLTIHASTISSNRVSQTGGGLHMGWGEARIYNSTFSGNSAAGDLFGGGGAIHNQQGSLVLNSSTITANMLRSGTRSGGGIVVVGGTERLTNTIVAGNFRNNGATPDDISGSVDSADHTLIGDAATAGGVLNGVNGNIVGNNGSGTLSTGIVVDSLLADNGGPTPTHRLIGGGLAVDTGNNVTVASMAYDQRGPGHSRIAPSITDIGAYEIQRPQALEVGQSHGGFRMKVKAEPHERLRIEWNAAVGEAGWQTLTHRTTDASGNLEHTEAIPPNTRLRFYRHVRP